MRSTWVTLARASAGAQAALGTGLAAGAAQAVGQGRAGGAAGVGYAAAGLMVAVAAAALLRAPMRHRAWRPALLSGASMAGFARAGAPEAEAVLAAVLALAAVAVWACWDMTEPWIVGVGQGTTVAPGTRGGGVAGEDARAR